MTASETVALSTLPEDRAIDKPMAPQRWATELGGIGFISASVGTLAFAPMMHLNPLGFAAIAGVLAGMSGAALGAVLPQVLSMVRKVPIPLLVLGGLGVGGAWGALVGALTAAAMGGTGMLFETSVVFTGVGGAIQLGWWWLPYLRRAVLGHATWPLMVLATVLAPMLGYLGLCVADLLFW